MDTIGIRQILLDDAHQHFIRHSEWPDAEIFAIEHKDHIPVLDEMQSKGFFEVQANKLVPNINVLPQSKYWNDEKKGIDIVYPILQTLFGLDRKAQRSIGDIMKQRMDVMWPPEGQIAVKRKCLYLSSVGVLGFTPGPEYKDAGVMMNLNILRYKDFAAALASRGGVKSLAYEKDPSIDVLKGKMSFSGDDLQSARDAVMAAIWDTKKMKGDLPTLFAAAEKRKCPLSLVMIDIDHFKQVNDMHKHQKGNEVLAAVAECVSTVAAGKGEVYRYGGEEILVALINHDTQEALAIAERIRRAMESAPMAGVKVTASFGVGSFPEHGKTSEEIINAADTAMYDAKNLGRNLVRIFKEPAPKTGILREPERKLPTPGGLTDRQRKELRSQHFRGIATRCPNDDALLKIEEITAIGVPTASLLIWCKMCGLSEQL